MQTQRRFRRRADPVTMLRSRYKVDESGCWLWLGRLNRYGYGDILVDGVYLSPHRWAFEVFTGQTLEDGVEIHHTCEVRHCVNPDHLEAVTRAEHAARHHIQVCKKGLHPMTGDNLIHNATTRRCRACMKEKQREWYRRKKGLTSPPESE